MSGHDSLFELSLSLDGLRALLESSTLPPKKLNDVRRRATDLGDECYFHIGLLWARPNALRAANFAKAKSSEIDALKAELRQPKSKAGRRPAERVPMNDLTIARMYLAQPQPGKSVEKLIDEAIAFKGFDGRNVKTSVHARRVRRLIARIRKTELATD
ncbi:hypothetical protein QY049_03230 [Bradyrhizobium sp. WYCCWR 13022]|uniref:hypothetical protein n=1 Tax=unclassified Bradyrhizobium TaxID=2631580 RepID=UPI00263A4415|nr:hypothetical protein [Bradyrhizobium sp. WYCCWR 13022]MDN4982238.1 hypothetical protein [Bradyrhizobium sp. WYCCWR 13022]